MSGGSGSELDLSDDDDGEAEGDLDGLRKALDNVVGGEATGVGDEDDESDGSQDGDLDDASASSMNDEQMMAIDERLAEVFKSKANHNKSEGEDDVVGMHVPHIN